jgi:hypothetical protein
MVTSHVFSFYTQLVVALNGPLGDFLPSNFIELLHVYYTVDSASQGFSSQSKHNRSSIIPSCIGAMPSSKFKVHGGGDFFSTGLEVNFENVL